ncbi:group I truncated hemoglobin [Catellatospora tritici]|uniref:group I truncated hemoglobin n=1 Tax=Catellatospora tritici TaxID=2851566 RepID=UPI001C2D1916|nr:group 1 truncated hemoglobin [Catellatospora tritici]MBV1852757.1 group 1 truncated hemoglobin [Catellatospora tritici]
MTQTPTAPPTDASLYELIGGAPAVREAVSRLYTYLLADEHLRGYFDGVDVATLKGHMAQLLTFVLGGPGTYPVERLQPAHARLDISGEHFDRTAQYVAGVLFELHVPMDIILQIGEILGGVRPLIVAAA